MIIIRNTIATKYSRAFLRVINKPLTNEELKQISRLKFFLSSNKTVIIFLSVPSIPLEKKYAAVDTILNYFKLSFEYKNLMRLLLHQNRISLLGRILENIGLIHAKSVKQEAFTVQSSHELTIEEREAVNKFIQHKLSSDITTTFHIDKNLISGLRIQSTYHYWERSMAKQLKLISQNLHLQGAL